MKSHFTSKQSNGASVFLGFASVFWVLEVLEVYPVFLNPRLSVGLRVCSHCSSKCLSQCCPGYRMILLPLQKYGFSLKHANNSMISLVVRKLFVSLHSTSSPRFSSDQRAQGEPFHLIELCPRFPIPNRSRLLPIRLAS